MKLIRRENLRINGEPVPETGLLDINPTGIRREHLYVNGEPVAGAGIINIITSSGNSSGGIEDVTYHDLLNLSNSDSLKPGAFYAFDHYHRNYFTGNGYGANVYDNPTPERLITQALGISELSEHVGSITFPHDEIMYSFEGGSNASGIMVKRVDKIRNITMNLDWRKAKFWNYKTSQLTNVLTGDQENYRNIYIGSVFQYISSIPILIDNYQSTNIHINQLRSPLYLESSSGVRIDTYSTEYEPKSFVSLNNVQINNLNIDAHSNVLNEVLINNVIGCVVNINNNSGGSTTVEDLFNPTITIK